MSKNNILDVLAAAALRATGGSVPKAIRLLSEPFAMAPKKRTSGEDRADAIILHYAALLDELEKDGVFSENFSREQLTSLWREALIEGRFDEESADGETVPDGLENAPHLVLLYRVLKANVSVGDEDVERMNMAPPYVDGAPPPPATKKARGSEQSAEIKNPPRADRRTSKWFKTPVHDGNQIKDVKKGKWDFLMIYLTVRYSKKPYDKAVFLPIQPKKVEHAAEVPWQEFIPALEAAREPGRRSGQIWPDDEFAETYKRAGGTYSQAVRSVLCDNLMKQYFGIQGPIIVPLEDQEAVFNWADAYMARKGIKPTIARDRWRTKLLLDEADVLSLDKFFESQERKDEFNRVLALKTNIWVEPKYYKHFHWAAHPYGESAPVAEEPTLDRKRNRPSWLRYRPENNLPFDKAGTYKAVSSPDDDDEVEVRAIPRSNKTAAKKTRVSSSSSPGTGPTIEQMRNEIELSRKRLDKETRKRNPNFAYVKILTSRMGAFAAQIAQKQEQQKQQALDLVSEDDSEEERQEDDDVLLRSAVPRRRQQQQRRQLALDMQREGRFTESQDALNKVVDLVSEEDSSDVQWYGEPDSTVAGDLDIVYSLFGGEGINFPSPVQFGGNESFSPMPPGGVFDTWPSNYPGGSSPNSLNEFFPSLDGE